MSDDVLIKVQGVSKKFCRDLKKSLWYGVKDIASDLKPFVRNGKPTPQTSSQAAGRLREDEFWGVDDVSFELRRGECLGLIGRNGAGKTTLLKMLNGLIKPDAGRLELHGRTGALIALGAGFNPILTGRENTYVNGSVLGLAKAEIDAKLDEIIDFADMRDFIDTPVQSYSSGMQVRLGFAIATALKPDILLLDEVLAVGDAAFRAKCYNKIGELQKRAAVIFVSHSMQQVAQVCSSVLFMKKGKVHWLGAVAPGVAHYMDDNTENTGEQILSLQPPVQSGELTVSPEVVEFGEFLNVRLAVETTATVPACSLRVGAFNPEGTVVAEWNSKRAGVAIDLVPGENVIQLRLGPFHLRRGTYDLGFILNDSTGVSALFWSLRRHKIAISGEASGLCDYQVPHDEVSINSNGRLVSSP